MAIIFEERVLADSVTIATTPDKIWDFFENLEKNYVGWHPDDHIVCR